MGYSREKLSELSISVKKFGIEKTAKNYNIKTSTLERAMRKSKKLKIEYDYYLFKKDGAKILLLDIETLPMHVRVWGLYKQRISIDNVINDWIMLSWSAKWLFDPEIYSDILTVEEVKNRDDERITKSIWEMIDSADIIIAHNLKRFDIRKLNARFILNGISRPSHYKMIDTLTESRRCFSFSSHKLEYHGRLLRNQGKIDTNYQLWIDCENGKQDALDKMLKYNKEDVNLLEAVYVWIRGWIKNHPNVGLYLDIDYPVCRNCGNENLKTLDNWYITGINKYTAYQCEECGATGRLTSETTREQRNNTLRALK